LDKRQESHIKGQICIIIEELLVITKQAEAWLTNKKPRGGPRKRRIAAVIEHAKEEEQEKISSDSDNSSIVVPRRIESLQVSASKIGGLLPEGYVRLDFWLEKCSWLLTETIEQKVVSSWHTSHRDVNTRQVIMGNSEI